MTLEEFFKHLPVGRWHITQDGSIRWNGRRAPGRHWHCPITLVCEIRTLRRFRPSQFEEAARVLGLRLETAAAIVDAADAREKCLPTPRLRALRRRLLDHVGLRERR